MKSHNLISPLKSFFKPLARVPLPLLEGFTRQRLQQIGVQQRQVLLDGSYLNYYHMPAQAGADPAAPPILLVHGIADSALTWALMLRGLSTAHAVYALDLPGYGCSTLPPQHSYESLDEMRDLLASFIRAVIGRPALVVGNSLGGWLAITLAWAEPALVRGIVPINPGGAPLNGRESWDPFREIVAASDLETARTIYRQLFHTAPAPLLYLSQYGLQESFQRQTLQEFIKLITEDEFLRDEDVRNVPVPAALVWGRSDRFLPSGSLEFFCDAMPDAPKLLLDHCGHLPQRERPREVVRFVKEFAAQLTDVPAQAR